ncbi:hypothetical protein [Pilimelia columellifera]|uniref:hypothetical protein n=1 Tax=Pilimelia columellifera TaxID=706574 RepID=UPI0031DA93ED
MLDGLSSPNEDNGCHHGTKWFVAQLGGCLCSQLVNDETSLKEALRSAIDMVAQRHARTCDLTHLGTPSSTVAILRNNDHKGAWEYLLLADSVVVIDDLVAGVQAISDKSVDRVATREKADIALHQVGTPEHRESVERLIAAQRLVRNRAGGYWIASADPNAADHALTGELPTGRLRRAAVLSDGAARLVDPYKLMNWPDLLDLAAAGAARLIHRVREADQADAKGAIWARYKTSDDATVIYIGPPRVPVAVGTPRASGTAGAEGTAYDQPRRDLGGPIDSI